ncbi:MAG TPA: glycerophosphodiester phosphodiesterase family protein [Methylomirabilota bacterium]|nr:glycerophosphodiester phosphodiesterase family protein [Methylomirabilota bacterium]
MASPAPAVIAHRGASAEAPEHTIAAFELAMEQGADGLALEVHLSADQHPIVFGDFTVDRTTDGTGVLAGLRVRDLKRLDAGGWRGRRFAGQRVQTLQEVLERFRERTRFWLQLTGGPEVYPGLEERVVSMLEIYDVIDRVLVQSFDRAALEAVRSLQPALRVGLLLARRPPDRSALGADGPNAICPETEACTEDLVAEVRAAGRECYVWTVHEPALADRLVKWGVNGIVTDRPGAVRARLGR